MQLQVTQQIPELVNIIIFLIIRHPSSTGTRIRPNYLPVRAKSLLTGDNTVGITKVSRLNETDITAGYTAMLVATIILLALNVTIQRGLETERA